MPGTQWRLISAPSGCASASFGPALPWGGLGPPAVGQLRTETLALVGGPVQEHLGGDDGAEGQEHLGQLRVSKLLGEVVDKQVTAFGTCRWGEKDIKPPRRGGGPRGGALSGPASSCPAVGGWPHGGCSLEIGAGAGHDPPQICPRRKSLRPRARVMQPPGLAAHTLASPELLGSPDLQKIYPTLGSRPFMAANQPGLRTRTLVVSVQWLLKS